MKRWEIFLLLFLGVLGVFSIFLILPGKRIFFNVKVAGINLGGLTLNEAEEKILEAQRNFENQNLIFSFQNKTQTYPIKNLNLAFDFKEALNKAFFVGKEKGLILNFKEKVLALQGKFNFFPEVQILNKDDLENFIGTNFGAFETLPQNAKLVFDKESLSFKISPHKTGKVFNLKKIEETIEKNASLFKPSYLELELEEKEPLIKEEDLISIKSEAEKILNQNFSLIAPSKRIVLKKEEIGEMLEIVAKKEGEKLNLSLALDDEALANFLEKKRPEIEILPKSPLLEIKDEKVVIKTPGREGLKLNIEKSIKEIQRSFEMREKEARLVVEKIGPQIDEKNLENFKINKIIGKAKTSFASSPQNRIHNIKLGVEIISGTLVAPNEIFSFNQTLGEVSPERGFLPELVIKPGKMIKEYGGGLCQLSTTLFRAAVLSGLEIIERTPHAFALRYYGTPGFDATVYFPSPDLKFKNNTPSYIVIQGRIEGTNLIFEIFGQDDGRKVEIEGPTILEVKEDGSMKTRLDVKVFKDDKLFLSQTFFSNYKSPKLYPVVNQ